MYTYLYFLYIYIHIIYDMHFMIIIIIVYNDFINNFYLQLDFKQFFFTKLWSLVWGGGTGLKSLPDIRLA
jgi:hypothetical protein